MLRDFSPRLYQETILDTCAKKSTLVVLPTGLGKTMVAMMLAVQRIKQYPLSKILFLAPTRPLVEQHLQTFKKHLDLHESQFAVFTGQVSPEKRAAMWKESQFFFSTPQGMENDIISERIKLEEVALIVFDEAHRATGDYAYNFIAKRYNKKAHHPRVLALTASPGSDLEKIMEVCTNLCIEDVELRMETDPDVKPYVQEIEIDWVKVELPLEMKNIRKYLQLCYRSKLAEVKGYGYIRSGQEISKTELLKVQGMLHMYISKGDKSFEIMKSVSLIAEAMKAQHALELLETQGISPLTAYFNKLDSEEHTSKVKALKNLLRDANFKAAKIMTRKLVENNIEHPKMAELKKIVEDEVKKNPGIKIIIFNQYRDTATKIAEELKAITGVTSRIFFGQAKKKGVGLSQKEQKKILEDFKAGEFNCLVATSVAEEGLDIPSVGLVLFYEPVPSGIRTIQRRGRTGRLDKGHVIVLMAKDTRDEGYKWSAHHKEKRMKKTLVDLKKKFNLSLKPATLDRYTAPESDIKVYADYREKGSGVIKELIDFGIKIDLQKLDLGDYLLSCRCGIECKKVPDFVDSIVDGRLLSQVKSMKEHFDRPLIIVEGTEDIYSQRKVHPNAIRGMLGMIAVTYGIPILQTKDFKETAALLSVIAKREQNETSKTYSVHGSKKPMSSKEQQEYIVSALPNIGPKHAKTLLQKYGTVLGVMVAGAKEIHATTKIGESKAKDIQKVLTERYEF